MHSDMASNSRAGGDIDGDGFLDGPEVAADGAPLYFEVPQDGSAAEFVVLGARHYTSCERLGCNYVTVHFTDTALKEWDVLPNEGAVVDPNVTVRGATAQSSQRLYFASDAQVRLRIRLPFAAKARVWISSPLFVGCCPGNPTQALVRPGQDLAAVLTALDCQGIGAFHYSKRTGFQSVDSTPAPASSLLSARGAITILQAGESPSPRAPWVHLGTEGVSYGAVPPADMHYVALNVGEQGGPVDLHHSSWNGCG